MSAVSRKFALYDIATGVIAQINLAGSVDDVLAICGAGQNAVEVAPDVQDDTHYIVGGNAAPYPPKLLPMATWDIKTVAWVDPRSLSARQDEKWAQAKAERAKASAALLVTPYGTFDADPDSRESLVSAIVMLQTLTALGRPAAIDWTLADNSVVTLDTTQLVTVGLLLGQQVQAAFTAARAKRVAIYAAKSVSELALT